MLGISFKHQDSPQITADHLEAVTPSGFTKTILQISESVSVSNFYLSNSRSYNTSLPSLVMDELKYTCRHYGDHKRQRVGIWEFVANKPSGYWLIFIHGGAWRTPTNTEEDFLPSVKYIVSSADVSNSAIRGFASIDYRLSPHPDFPQDPETPESELRVAQHPDHINDIWAALKLLATDYQLSNDYILMGHSAGAFLAHQLLMGPGALNGQAPPSEVSLPAAIIGISGIYELNGLNERHDGYTGFIEGAFGANRDDWNKVSPSEYHGNYREKWACGRLLLLAWSPEDSLVDEPEIDVMNTKLVNDGVNVSLVKDLTGDHNDVWEQGSQICRLVAIVLEKLQDQIS